MSAPRDQQRADVIFAEAMDRPPAARVAYVETACGEDETLQAEVRELLDHYSSAEDALTQTRTTHRISGRSDVEQVDLRTDTGRTVGTCRLDGRLPDDGIFERWATRRSGDGPPAILSLARQRLSVDESRRVGLHAESLLRLDHPGLPRVLEAGTVDLGRGAEAFFLIEQIDGTPLPEGPSPSTTDLRRRVESLVSMCDAVQELHFHGLVHGSVSAARCLITDDGAARLDDPGLLAILARATPESSAEKLFRDLGGAPERPVLATQAIDGRMDVYELGAMLAGWTTNLDGPFVARLNGIARQATSHDRQDRQRSAGAMGDDLRAVLTPPSGTDAIHDEASAGISPLAAAILITLAAAAAFAAGVVFI